MRLRRGWNRILIKTVVTDGPWRLFLRVTDPSGRPLPFVAEGERLPAALRAGPAAGRASRAASGATVSLAASEALRRRAPRATPSAAPGARRGAEAWLDLGRFLAWNQPGDREAREEAAALEASVARRPTSARAAAAGRGGARRGRAAAHAGAGARDRRRATVARTRPPRARAIVARGWATWRAISTARRSRWPTGATRMRLRRPLLARVAGASPRRSNRPACRSWRWPAGGAVRRRRARSRASSGSWRGCSTASIATPRPIA